MGAVLRWGRAAYETDADLAREAADAASLGMSWSLWTERSPPPTLGDADVLVVHSGTRLDATALADFRGGLIVTTTSGHDHIDLASVGDAVVARCPLARRDAVVEHALGALLGQLRRLDALHAAARAGRWARAELPFLAPRGLSGMSVAVVGLGVIGRRMREVLGVLGAEVLAVDPFAPDDGLPRVTLADALGSADAVTLHCSLSSTSRALIDATALAGMRSSAVLINTARGDVLDLAAAIEAVTAGHLGGLVVDVFPEEPYPALAAGAAVPGVWFTPHASGYTVGLGARVAEGVHAAIAAWAGGQPVPFPVSA